MTGAIVAMVLVGLVLVASGLLVIGVADRTADGRIGRNGYAGIRTQATQSSDEAWLAAHQAGHARTKLGGQMLLALGPVAAIVGLLAGGGDPDSTLIWWSVVCGILTVALTVLIIVGAIHGQRAATEVQQRAS